MGINKAETHLHTHSGDRPKEEVDGELDYGEEQERGEE